MKTVKDYITYVRVKMYKDGLTTFKLSQILGVDHRTLSNLFYSIPETKGKLFTFVKLLNYLEGGVIDEKD